MKKHPLICCLICLLAWGLPLGAIAQEEKPQWQYVINGPDAAPGIPGVFWQELSYAADKEGNAAVIAKVQDGNFNPLGIAMLWISSKGKLLGKIKLSSQPTILSVSATSLFTTDDKPESDKNGNPYAVVKYSLDGANVIRTPFGVDGAGILSLIPGGFPLSIAPVPLSGLVLQKTSGTTNTVSFYHF